MAALTLVFAVQPVVTAWAGPQEATPGPAARVGGAIDRAWLEVRDDVFAALLAARVRIALLDHLGGDGLKVRTEIEDGRVTLRGAVTSRANRDLAGKAVAAVSGVEEVENHITVAPEGAEAKPPLAGTVEDVEREVADAWLEASVKVNLIEELGRVALAVEVEAAEGVVSLSGSVPDVASRELAVRVAKQTRGTVRVVNGLRLDS